jgi:hypothetical protein
MIQSTIAYVDFTLQSHKKLLILNYFPVHPPISFNINFHRTDTMLHCNAYRLWIYMVGSQKEFNQLLARRLQ